ncbi:MAG: response regulator transcription factor [Thiobacillus sp.]
MSKRILVVDDEKPLANALVLKLNHAGYETTACYDGSEALDELTSQKYDLVLLDLIMPNMDGFEFMEKVKQKGLKVPIVISSNLSQTEDLDRAESLGAVDFFIKSDTPMAVVVEKVSKILG